MESIIAISIVILTVIIYLLMTKLYAYFKYSFFMPLLTTSLVIIGLLLLFNIPYETYMIGGHWINQLLGPAIVALAYPLYSQRHTLLKYISPILGGVIVGSIVGIVSGILLGKLFAISKTMILSIVSKSITTPVAIQITAEIGGIPALTVIFVLIAGFTGMIVGPMLFKWFHIHSLLGKGISLGSGSHVIGTSKAIEYGELTSSMSSVSMTLSAVLGSILAPIMVWLFL
jgi:predicted murein hydrolase (TIGR00659 family)